MGMSEMAEIKEIKRRLEALEAAPVVKFKKLHPDAKVPTYAHPTDSGADLYALYDAIIGVNPILVHTGIGIELPPGYEAQVRSRSSMAKAGVMVANGIGTIDQGYAGSIGVLLVVPAAAQDLAYTYTVRAGDRIGQLVISPIKQASFQEIQELPPSKRGEGGFGSTGR